MPNVREIYSELDQAYRAAGYDTPIPNAPIVQLAVAVRDLLGRALDVRAFGAVGDGVTDNTAAFRAAYAAVASTGGVIYIPPGRYFLDFTGADVVNNPIVVLQIEKDNVWIVGAGPSSEIIIGGITAAQLNAGSNDPSSAGNDVATVFNWENCNRGGAVDVRFTGTGGGTAITVGKARAKGCSVMNAQRITMTRVSGSDIPGNVINYRGNTGAEATSSSYGSVIRCITESCSESGVNFMGGTFKLQYIGNQSRNNQYHGLESGTFGLICKGNIFTGNQKTGVSQVGHYGLIQGNYSEGNNFAGINLQYNSASFAGACNTVRGNTTKQQTNASSAGVLVDENVVGAVVDDNYLLDEVEGVKLAGIAGTDPVVDAVVTNNKIFDIGAGRTNYGVNMIHADNVVCRHNIIYGAITNSIIGQAAGDVGWIEYNVVDAPINRGSMTNTVVARNVGGGNFDFGVSADHGDAAATLTVGTSEPVQLWDTPLTAARAVALGTTNAYNGATFRVTRGAAATGAFNLNVGTGPLKALTAAGQWCDVSYSGPLAAWILTASGSL